MTDDLESQLQAIKQLDEELTKKYQSVLIVNQDLDRSLVSYQANKAVNGHRWYKYKEGFSGALVQYILSTLSINNGRLIDPFLGSGTALFEASDRGLNATGIELLPCSAEIVDIRRIVRTKNKKSIAKSLYSFSEMQSWNAEGERKEFKHLRITKGAFPEDTEKKLERFLYEAECLRDKTLARLLRFSALCILESISYTRKDGQYLRWDSRSGRRAGGKPFDKGVIQSFDDAITKKLNQIADDISGASLLFPEETNPDSGKIELLQGSCLEILPTLGTNTFDILVTSPPYCNRYDYTRTYALELALMDVTEDGIRDLRQRMLSCTVENREKENLSAGFRKDISRKAQEAFDSHKVLHTILSYLEQCREEGKINNPGIPRMVRNYFYEMALIIFEAARILKPGSPFVMVNDNVRYHGAHVPVDLILSDFAQAAGMEVERIWVLPRGKGNSSQQMGEHGRMEIRKCVYVWRVKGKSATQSGPSPVRKH